MDISMGENHKAQFLRYHILGEYLVAERERLAAELRYVAEQGQRLDALLAGLLRDGYALDAYAISVQLDCERGMLVVPDPPDPPPPPAPDPPDDPPDDPTIVPTLTPS